MTAFDPDGFLDALRRASGYEGQLVHVQRFPARAARLETLSERLSPAVLQALRAAHVDGFYTHQAQAIDAVLAGRHIVVATSTASGKTLCYGVPVLETLARDPLARALFIYPTKALAQDQLRKWNSFARGAGESVVNPIAATYDGDTPQGARSRLRKSTRVLLTNPDMLHAGILPNHPLWAEFLRHLRYVVIDEAHVYRGVFGSQVACVLRRLRRVCAQYQEAGGARAGRVGLARRLLAGRVPQTAGGPTFIATSATIANPEEHFRLLTGLHATLIDADGSPHGPRSFALWNPALLDATRSARRSANHEATQLFVSLLQGGVRTITFTRARVVAELVLRYARDRLKRETPELVDRIASYRAGYLPAQRRRIEADLFGGKLMGVTATTALELGIDVGGLDASLLVGFPGTIASMWQQAGRAGRGENPSLAVLIGQEDPLNQFYMRHPENLLNKPLEHALLAPDNPYILRRHLPCAAHEFPLSVPVRDASALPDQPDDEELFGPGFVDAMIGLEEEDTLRYLPTGAPDGGQRWVYTRGDHPAQLVNLRDAAGDRFAILNAADQYRTLEELSASTAPQRVHQGAVYLHQGETFLVTEFNCEMRHAIVQPAHVDYFTQTRELNDLNIVRSLRHRLVGDVAAYLGQVRVRGQVIGYRRIQQFSDAVLGEEPLDMPANEFETVALWWDLPEDLPPALAARGLDFLGGIHAAEHAAIGILPLFAMCDRWDIGGLSTPRHPDTDAAQVFIYDGFPGGVGIAEKGFELLPELWSATLDVVQACPCEGGCPSCVQSPKCGNFNNPLDKMAAVAILRRLLRAR